MIDKALGLIAPHYCYGCGKSGGVLCPYCKYNIIQDSPGTCLLCRRPVGVEGVCGACNGSFSRAWQIGDKTDVLDTIISAYKFEHVKAASQALAALLDARLPILPADTIIVPTPTIPKHIRLRGYDHISLIARTLARTRHLPYRPLLRRHTNTVQLGSSGRQRRQQAENAFRIDTVLDGGTYLLIDDVVTTGATVQAGARRLKEAGASDVWVAVIARQPLD